MISDDSEVVIVIQLAAFVGPVCISLQLNVIVMVDEFVAICKKKKLNQTSQSSSSTNGPY